MKCFKCGADFEMPANGKLPFRATCEKCLSSLHCCKNCQNYKPGLPNDCRIPDTEYISDREAQNFCEYFEILKPSSSKADTHDVSKKLFGEAQTPPKSFKDLFND